MRLTRRTALGIAIACGGLAALLSVVYLQSLQRQRAAPPVEKQQVDVVVPRVNIPSRTVITPDMLTMAAVDEDRVPRGALTDPTLAVGQVATQRLVAGQPVLRTQITDRATAFGLAGIVPPGLRAVTVPVDPVTGVAGLLKPGDRVDVIATFEVGETLVAQTVLQDVELLALGTHTTDVTPAETTTTTEAKDEQTPAEETTRARRETVEYPNATLGVTPEDAQKLMLAEQRGKLRLALRPVGEHDFVPVPAHDLAGVVGPEYARLLMARKREEPEEDKPAPEPAVQPTPPWPTWPAPPTVEPAPKPADREPAKEPAKKEPEPKPPPQVEVIRRDQRETVVP